MLINGLDLPYTTSDPDSKERRKSSPTIVFRMAGSTVVGSIISAVIILLAAANDAVFCGDMTASDAIHRQLCVKVLFRLEQEADTLDCCPGTFDISVLRFEIRIVDTGQLRIYALRYQGAKNNQKLAPMDMLTTVYNSTVVDMPTLFDGAYNCTAEGKAGGAVVNTNVGAGGDGNGPGTLDMSCLSRLPIYLQCKDACPMSVRVDGKCPFGFTGKGC